MICPRRVLWTAMRAALPLSVVMVVTIVGSRVARADQITVDWTNPDIQKFAKQGKPNFPIGGDAASQVAALKLPVLAFDSVPQLVQNALPVGTVPTAPIRQLITDPADPTWYQINDQYGDITISILASLTVNREVAASTIYQAPAPQAAGSQGDPTISMLDENGEGDSDGLIIEYTVYKFPNIPYTVTIECSHATKNKCSDLSVVAKDQTLLTVIAATPPK
jgi:hypothetical protein